MLVLTTAGFGGTDFLLEALAALAPAPPPAVAAYASRDAAAPGRPDLARLLYANGSASGAPLRRRGLIMYPNVEAMGYLSRAEVEMLWAWQARQPGLRKVAFGAWSTYVGFLPDMEACSSDDRALLPAGEANTTGTGAGAQAGAAAGASPAPAAGGSLSLLFAPDAPLLGAALASAANVSLSAAFLGVRGLYRCPGIRAAPLPTCSIWPGSDIEAAGGLHPGCTSKPFLSYDAGGASVAATLVTYFDAPAAPAASRGDGGGGGSGGGGRQALAFTMDCAAWSASCRLLGRYAVAWMLAPQLAGDGDAAGNGAAAGGNGAAAGGNGAATNATGANGTEAAAPIIDLGSVVVSLLQDIKNPPQDAGQAAARNGAGAAAARAPAGGTAAAAAGGALLLLLALTA